ncbi:MAG: Rieske (2Fe-2S) protein [Panacagrimonas sp.]
MAELHKVGLRSQLGENQHLAAKAGTRDIALFLVDGKVIATAGKCPHAGGPLHKGKVCAGKLSCPWHGWIYDLATGECEESDDVNLARFEVQLEGDDIFVVI